MEFENSIGKLNGKGKAELAEYANQLGDELVSTVIGRCADLGGPQLGLCAHSAAGGRGRQVPLD